MNEKSPKTLQGKNGRPYSFPPEGGTMAKQPRGVKKLANGRYRARYFAGYNKAGKRVYPARTFDLQSEALDWLAEERPSRSGGANGYGLTVAVFLDQWLAMKHNLRSNSVRTYRCAIDKYIKPGLGSIRLRRLEAAQIDAWQGQLLKQKLAKATINGARSILFSACEKAVRMELLKRNPVTGTDGVGQGKAKPARHLSIDEAQQLISACDYVRFGVLFELTIRTGLRPEEVIGLTWGDLDLSGARGSLHVHRVVHHPEGGGWCWQEPKSESGKRTVLFPADLASRLTEHRRKQLEEKMKAGPSWQNNDLVFANHVGNPIRYCILRKHFKNLLAHAELPAEIVTHKLRHFFVTSGLASGVDLKTVSREVGHSKPSFTADHYGDVVPEMFEGACDKREQLLKRKR